MLVRAKLFAAAGAAVLAAASGLFFLLTEPAEAPGAGQDCARETQGPLLVVDCGFSRDAPLRVYSRWPVRYLGECGYSAEPGGALCAIVFWLRNR